MLYPGALPPFPRLKSGNATVNLFDLFAFGSAALFVLAGLWKGLVRQLFTLAGILGGSALALNGYQLAARWLPFVDSGVRQTIAFLVLLLGCVVLSWLFGHGFSRLVESLTLGWANRFAGGVLGLAKAAFLSAVAALFLVRVLPQNSAVLRESVALPYVLTVAEQGLRLAPDDVEEDVGKKLASLRKAWERR